MGIATFQKSRFMRATAGLTLCFFLSGCIPGNLKSADGIKDSAAKLSDSTGSLIKQAGSLSNLVSTVSQSVGVDLPGSRKGYDQRTWSAEDQAGAERALAAFSGKAVDGLAVYDPLKQGESSRYAARIKDLVSKYGSRSQLSPDEVMEFAEVVVPMMRFLVKSKTYRASLKSPSKVTRNAKGNDTVVIPAFSTVELVALTYCNDHALPAPWRGEKLHFRPMSNYIPSQLGGLYKDLHTYAATHPNAHYRMQSLVWALRDEPCKAGGLTTDQKALIEAAHKGGLGELQAYCVTKKLKDHAIASVKNFIPGSSATKLAQYQQYIAQAADYQAKADAFLKADMSDPLALLALAKTAGIQPNLSRNPLFNNPQLKQALPLLRRSGLTNALIPKGPDAQAVATTLGVMEELGRVIGEEAGVDQGSIADYSDLGDGLYAHAKTDGGASHAQIKVTNTSGHDKVFKNTDFVLTSVDDKASGRKNYKATQRLSPGPLQPIKVYPNEPDAHKRYTPKNEKDVERALDPLNGMKPQIGDEPSEEAQEKVACPINNVRWGDIALNAFNEGMKVTPFIGQILNLYAVTTGREWITGVELDPVDQFISGLNVFLPAGAAGLFKFGVKAGSGVRATISGAREHGSKWANYGSALLQGGNGFYEYETTSGCKGWQRLAMGAANLSCTITGTKKCIASTAVAGAVGAQRFDMSKTPIGKFIDIENMQFDMGQGALGRSLTSGVDAVKSWFR